MIDDSWNGSDHAQPDPGEISQVEDVVELGWRGHHLGLGGVPQHSRDGDQFFSQNANVLGEATTEKNSHLK